MPRGRRSKKKSNKLDLQVVVLIIASILLGVLIYTKAGYVGGTLSPVLGGIMGWIKYVVPVGTFAIAIFLACDEEKEKFTKKIIEYAVLLLCVTTIITVIQVAQGTLDINKDFEDVVIDAYNKGAVNRGGGAVGAITGVALISLLGKAGTVVFTIGVALITSIFLFGIKPAEILRKYIENKNARKKEVKIERAERFKQRQLNIEEIPEVKEEKKRKYIKEVDSNTITEEQINIKIASNEPQEGLFKKEEEVKEDKSREVLVLEHALTVEDENNEVKR